MELYALNNQLSTSLITPVRDLSTANLTRRFSNHS